MFGARTTGGGWSGGVVALRAEVADGAGTCRASVSAGGLGVGDAVLGSGVLRDHFLGDGRCLGVRCWRAGRARFRGQRGAGLGERQWDGDVGRGRSAASG